MFDSLNKWMSRPASWFYMTVSAVLTVGLFQFVQSVEQAMMTSTPTYEDFYPSEERTWIVRTDYSDDGQWLEIQKLLENPPEPFFFDMHYVQDPGYQDMKLPQALKLLPTGEMPAEAKYFAFVIADKRAMTEPGYPLLVVDLTSTPYFVFRCEASKLSGLENNLMVANIGLDDLKESLDADGVYRQPQKYVRRPYGFGD